MSSWQITPYLILILLAGLLTAGLAFYTWRRRAKRGAKALLAVLLASSIWSFAYALELTATTLEAKLLWVKVEYVGIAILPVAWLLFALIYTTPIGRRRVRRYALWLSLIPAASLLLLWTNERHGLFYASMGTVDSMGVAHFAPQYGPWFWVHTVYSYFCYLVGAGLFLRFYQRLSGVDRSQVALLLVGSLPPFIANFIFLFSDISLDPAPIAFTLTAVLFAWGFFRFGLLETPPEIQADAPAMPADAINRAQQQSRERVLNLALVGITVLGLLQFLSAVYGELTRPAAGVPNWNLIAWSGVLYAFIVFITFVRRLPYGFRAGAFLLLLFLFSVSNIQNYGLDIDAGFTLFAFLVFSYLLFGVRLTLLSLLLSAATVALHAWLIISGRLEVTPFYTPGAELTTVAVPVASFMLFVLVVIGALASLQNDLRSLLQRSHALSEALEKERSLLEQRVTERTRALATSIEVSARLSTILDPDQLVGEVVDQLRQAFDYYHVHIYVGDDTRRRLLMVGGTGEAGRIMLARGHYLEAGHGLVGYAASTGQIVLVPDVRQDDRWLPNPLLPDTRAELAVPIKLRNEVLGVLDVQDNQVGGLNDEDAELLQSVANQVAVALRNARLYAETQERAEQLALINRVVSSIAASLDLQQNMQIIVDELAQAIDVEQVGIALLNEQRTALTVVAEHFDPAVSPSAVGFVIPLEGNAATQQVITTRRPLVVEDAQHNPLTATAHEVMRQRGVATLIILPIIVGNEVVGTLGIDMLQEDVMLTDTQMRLAETLVYQAATAVQSTRLFERTEDALAETESLYQVSTELNRAQSFEDILAVVHRHSKIGGEADILHIAQFDRPWSEDELPQTISVLARWSAQPLDGPLPRYQTADVPALTYLRKDAPVVVENLEKDPRLDDVSRTVIRGPFGVESALFAPLVVGGRWVGYVGVFDQEPRKFADADVRHFMSVVRQAAVAAQTLILLDETQRALSAQARLSQQLRTVSAVGTAVTTILDLDRLLQAVVDLTKERFDLYHVHIYLLNERGDTLLLRAGAGAIGQQMVNEQRQIALAASSLVARAARRREAVIVNDTGAEPDFLPHRLLPQTRAEMAVPMLAGNRLVGVLDVQADEVGRFGDEDVLVQKTLASQIAVAVQNAYLYAEQVEAADKLREVDRLKSDFLASMSHELRTPLNSIIGFADVLLTGIDGELNERMQEDVEVIRNSGSHLRELIGDILDMSKIEAGRMELHYEEVDVHQLVNDVLSSASINAEEKQLQLNVELDKGVQCVRADRTRLRQVLWNMVGNAIKFTPQGHVDIKVQEQNGDVLFMVEDTGIGIKAEDMAVVFEQFRQADTSKSGTTGGTGLGMPISKRLVEMHGGRIGLESREGEGTRFWFTIPKE